ncbi:MAG: tRNA nucleotidyltransferase, partial [Solirubrobacterales bacterium]|nr:tRNA nucleotidyltransferase [Solirubrobacterales bacterium]
SAGVTVHDRFGTAVVDWPAGRVDLAERRAETYSAPGALPDVRAGSEDDDLRRRDFTVNAIAVALGGPRRGQLRAVDHALDDLLAERLRVLHERSFIDDPTRLLRLARYGSRLGFEAEPRTASLAREALAAGALATVSRARVGAELRLALAEPDPVSAFLALDELGVLAALEPRLGFDERLARRGLAMLPDEGREDVLLLAVLLAPLAAGPRRDAQSQIFEFLDSLEFTAADREAVSRTATLAGPLAEKLGEAERPSQVREAAVSCTLEAAALAGALADGHSSRARENAREWLQSWHHVGLAINGDDLLAAGIPAGPEVGRRLALALGRRLDGELGDGRDAELQAALEEQA